MQRTKLCTRAHMLAQSGPDWPNMDQSGVAAVFAVKDTDKKRHLRRNAMVNASATSTGYEKNKENQVLSCCDSWITTSRINDT